jgi:hypothetical protein
VGVPAFRPVHRAVVAGARDTGDELSVGVEDLDEIRVGDAQKVARHAAHGGNEFGAALFGWNGEGSEEARVTHGHLRHAYQFVAA